MSITLIMPLFLRTREPMRRDKLILGGATAFRHRSHRLRLPHRHVRKYHNKNVIPAKATAIGPKPSKRRRVITHRRRRGSMPTKKPRKQLRTNKLGKKQRTVPQNTLKKIATQTGKRLLNRVSRKAATSAKQVVQQLADSRQIKQAAKSVHADLSDAGSQLINRVMSNKKSRKRPAEEEIEAPKSKRSHFAPGFSRIGYRGKQIQRGGTKQYGGQYLF